MLLFSLRIPSPCAGATLRKLAFGLERSIADWVSVAVVEPGGWQHWLFITIVS